MIGIDIKMPKDCAHCPMDQDTYGGGYCLLTNTSTNAVRFVRRSDNCPLVTINDHPDEIKVTNCNHIADDSKKVSISCGHENGKDVIYMADAIDATCKRQDAFIERDDELDILAVYAYSDCKAVVKFLPSAQPDFDMTEKIDKAHDDGYKQGYLQGKADYERKKGKWLSHYEYCEKHGYIPSGLIAYWWCDQCEQAVEHPTNFCPNCGSDMRGEEHD